MISIVLVDDHPVVRDGLAGQIAGEDDLTLVGAAAGGHEALALVDRFAPDLVITDLRMRDGDGVELITELRRRDPALPILVLTTYGTDEDLRPALTAGPTSSSTPSGPRAAARPSSLPRSRSCSYGGTASPSTRAEGRPPCSARGRRRSSASWPTG